MADVSEKPSVLDDWMSRNELAVATAFSSIPNFRLHSNISMAKLWFTENIIKAP